MLLPLFLGKPVQAMVCPRTVPGLPADGRRVCSERRRSSFALATVGIGSLWRDLHSDPQEPVDPAQVER